MDLGGLLNPDGGIELSGTYSNETQLDPTDLVLPDFIDTDFWFNDGSDLMQYEAPTTYATGFGDARQFEADQTAHGADRRNSGSTVIGAELLGPADETRSCYGMVGLPIPYSQQDMSPLIDKLTAEFHTHGINSFTVEHGTDRIALLLADRTDFGHLRKTLIKAFEELRHKAPGVSLEAVGVTQSILENLHRAIKPSDARCHVDINVYGPQSQAEIVGKVLMSHKLWLQRPDNYKANEFPYVNPHTISFPGMKEEVVMQEPQELVESSSTLPQSEEEVLDQVMAEVHDHLTRDQGLAMESGGQSIKTELLPHQRRALKYMLERESGDIPAKYRLWEETLSGVTKVFVHRITGSRAFTQPNERGGGVLADEMGTGKSLSTLALITRTLDVAKVWLQQKREARVGNTKVEFYASTTLVIVPSAQLIANWVHEIDCHTGATLKTFKYHGAERDKATEDLASYDVIVTTYNTIASDYSKKKSILHKIGWYRIVLDEAHYIRNHNTVFYRACCDLEANSRWCLSGTPIQNRLEDIGSLFSFLRAEPFHSRAEFRRTICVPFENREISTARDRLIMLYDSLVLRRSKDTCITDLPDPEEELRMLEFSPGEAAQYARTLQILERRLRNQAYFQHGASMATHSETSTKETAHLDSNAFRETGLYQALADENASRFSLFHAMMQLRILCNHGTYQHMFSWKKQRQNWDSQQERETFVGDTAAGKERVCDGCSYPMPQSGVSKPNDFVESCPHVVCLDCMSDATSNSNLTDPWRHCPICQRFGATLMNASAGARRHSMAAAGEDVMTEADEELGPFTDTARPDYFRRQGVSTKLNALMDDLRKDPEGTNRQVPCDLQSKTVSPYKQDLTVK
ncbi:hypothetical protein PG985_005393 [Apiospora marii]|uniref:uncharacterized protein n=1 Tax=Apiospora marii TaxID=335849 RepID=UPI0031304052